MVVELATAFTTCAMEHIWAPLDIALITFAFIFLVILDRCSIILRTDISQNQLKVTYNKEGAKEIEQQGINPHIT